MTPSVSVLRTSRFARVIGLVVAALTSTLLVEAAWAASLEEIKKRGYMIVATEDDYPPFEFVVDGKPMGYDHELLSILRKSAGFEVRQAGDLHHIPRPRRFGAE